MIIGLFTLCFALVLSLIGTNILWFKHLRYLTDMAVSKDASDFAIRQSMVKLHDKSETKKVKVIRPEGI